MFLHLVHFCLHQVGFDLSTYSLNMMSLHKLVRLLKKPGGNLPCLNLDPRLIASMLRALSISSLNVFGSSRRSNSCISRSNSPTMNCCRFVFSLIIATIVALAISPSNFTRLENSRLGPSSRRGPSS